MTPHGKPQHDAHIQPPVLHKWGNHESTTSAVSIDKFRRSGEVSIPGRMTLYASPRASLQPPRETRRAMRRRCEAGFPVRSTVLLRCVGVRSWANQCRGSAAGPARTSEQLFIPAAKIFQGSVSSSGRCGLMIRLRVWRSVQNARSVTRVFSSTASGSRTPRRCTRSMARSLAIESRAKEPEASGGLCAEASHAVRVGEPTRIGKLSWPAQGRTSNVSERGVTAGETALNSRASSHEKRWPDASGELPGTDPETSSSPGCRMGGIDRNRDATGRRDVHLNSSSGDGPGIQQPGSMTWGGPLVPTAPSGRADESAMCPAVARFNRRAA